MVGQVSSRNKHSQERGRFSEFGDSTNRFDLFKEDSIASTYQIIRISWGYNTLVNIEREWNNIEIWDDVSSGVAGFCFEGAKLNN